MIVAIVILSVLLVGGGVAIAVLSGDEDEAPVTAPERKSSDASTTTAPDSPTTERDAERVPRPAPAQASPFIGGTANPNLRQGEVGAVSVIAQGPMGDGGSIPVVVRNNTSDSVTDVAVAGLAQDGVGAVIASGEDQGLHPEVIKPGEIGFGHVYFGFDVSLPSDAAISFDVSSSDAESGIFFGEVDMEVAEVNLLEQRVVGVLRNPTDEEVSGPIDALVMCFDGDAPLATHGGFTDQDDAAPGASVGFQIELFDDPCPTFLVAGSGFDF